MEPVIQEAESPPSATVTNEMVVKEANIATTPPPAIENTPQEMTHERTEPEAARKGWLNITSDPWSEVYINGKFYGTTPLQQPVSLSSGVHRIECRRPNHETYHEAINITNGELSRRSVVLKKHMGRLVIMATDGAEFHIDGKLIGITPLTKSLEVDVGTHLLTLKKHGYHTWSSEITIEANQSIPLRITLSPQY
jgi:hypothetical protein